MKLKKRDYKYTARLPDRGPAIQLKVFDFTDSEVERWREEAPHFLVQFIPAGYDRSTSFSSAGKVLYNGEDFHMAWKHIELSFPAELELHDDLRRYL